MFTCRALTLLDERQYKLHKHVAHDVEGLPYRIANANPSCVSAAIQQLQLPGPDAAASEHHAYGKPEVDSEAFWSAQYKPAKNNYEL